MKEETLKSILIVILTLGFILSLSMNMGWLK
jgi:hypothetical protein